mgnify:CR=1 FL=1
MGGFYKQDTARFYNNIKDTRCGNPITYHRTYYNAHSILLLNMISKEIWVIIILLLIIIIIIIKT